MTELRTSVAVYPVRLIGRIRDKDIWQDLRHPTDIFVGDSRLERGTAMGWVLGWGTEQHEAHAHTAEWLAALTPAETCDLYATIEAAIANPPEPDT